MERAPSPPPVGRGRPPVRWQLTAIAAELFPDRHADLTVELIGSIRAALGEEGLERVLEARGQAQLTAYRKALPDPAVSSVPVRVRRLAEVRSAEGYLAEVKSDDDGSLVLVEHHCPVCDAASSLPGPVPDRARAVPGGPGRRRHRGADPAPAVGRPALCLPHHRVFVGWLLVASLHNAYFRLSAAALRPPTVSGRRAAARSARRGRRATPRSGRHRATGPRRDPWPWPCATRPRPATPARP